MPVKMGQEESATTPSSVRSVAVPPAPPRPNDVAVPPAPQRPNDVVVPPAPQKPELVVPPAPQKPEVLVPPAPPKPEVLRSQSEPQRVVVPPAPPKPVVPPAPPKPEVVVPPAPPKPAREVVVPPAPQRPSLPVSGAPPAHVDPRDQLGVSYTREQLLRSASSYTRDQLLRCHAVLYRPTIRTMSTAEVIRRCPDWLALTQQDTDTETDATAESPVGDLDGKADGADSNASTRGSDSEQIEVSAASKESKAGGMRADAGVFEPGMLAFGLTSARAREIAREAAEAEDRARWDRVLTLLAEGKL